MQYINHELGGRGIKVEDSGCIGSQTVVSFEKKNLLNCETRLYVYRGVESCVLGTLYRFLQVVNMGLFSLSAGVPNGDHEPLGAKSLYAR